ncbi:MAG: hypothetical protein WBC60_03820, partial [Cognaticolwellia sp.]
KKTLRRLFCFQSFKFQSLSDETWRRVVGVGVVSAITLTKYRLIADLNKTLKKGCFGILFCFQPYKFKSLSVKLDVALLVKVLYRSYLNGCIA